MSGRCLAFVWQVVGTDRLLKIMCSMSPQGGEGKSDCDLLYSS